MSENFSQSDVAPTTSKEPRAVFVPYANDQRTLCAACGQIIYDLSQSDNELTELYERMEPAYVLVVERKKPAPEVSWDNARGVPGGTTVQHHGPSATSMMLRVHVCHPTMNNAERIQRAVTKETLRALDELTEGYAQTPGWLDVAITEALRTYIETVDVAEITPGEIVKASASATSAVDTEIMLHNS